MSLMLAAQAVHHAVAAVPFCTTSVACAGVLRCLLKTGLTSSAGSPVEKPSGEGSSGQWCWAHYTQGKQGTVVQGPEMSCA